MLQDIKDSINSYNNPSIGVSMEDIRERMYDTLFYDFGQALKKGLRSGELELVSHSSSSSSSSTPNYNYRVSTESLSEINR